MLLFIAHSHPRALVPVFACMPIPPLPPTPRDEVNTSEAKFGFLQEGLALLNQIQRKGVYLLEPIFARGALPQQQHPRLRNVEEEFHRVMTQLDVRGGGEGRNSWM